MKFTFDEWVIRANNKFDNRFTYQQREQDNKIIVTCKIHGDSIQTKKHHMNSAGCPGCKYKNPSKNEKHISNFIKSLDINVTNRDRQVIKPKELDIFIKSHNIAIEYNGLYWHSDERLRNKYSHLAKTLLCNEKNIQLIQIFEDEWLYKKDIVKSRLKAILNHSDERIYGRNCIVKKITSSEAKLFLDTTHIQGYVKSPIRLGLFYNNELVACMTFANVRKVLGNKSNQLNHYELTRYSSKLNTTVVGGASKLLKYFESNYIVERIISYADLRWSKGNMYEQLGFTFEYNTKPNYFYVHGTIRESRIKYQKHKLVKSGYDANLTESEIMKSLGFDKIYDCGSGKWSKSYNLNLTDIYDEERLDINDESIIETVKNKQTKISRKDKTRKDIMLQYPHLFSIINVTNANHETKCLTIYDFCRSSILRGKRIYDKLYMSLDNRYTQSGEIIEISAVNLIEFDKLSYSIDTDYLLKLKQIPYKLVKSLYPHLFTLISVNNVERLELYKYCNSDINKAKQLYARLTKNSVVKTKANKYCSSSIIKFVNN